MHLCLFHQMLKWTSTEWLSRLHFGCLITLLFTTCGFHRQPPDICLICCICYYLMLYFIPISTVFLPYIFFTYLFSQRDKSRPLLHVPSFFFFFLGGGGDFYFGRQFGVWIITYFSKLDFHTGNVVSGILSPKEDKLVFEISSEECLIKFLIKSYLEV